MYDEQVDSGRYFWFKIGDSNVKNQDFQFSGLTRASILLRTYRVTLVLDSHRTLNPITIQSTERVQGSEIKEASLLAFEDDFEVIEDL